MQHSHKATVPSLFVSSLGECGQSIWITGRINCPIPSPADSSPFGKSCSFMLELAKHWLSEPPQPAPPPSFPAAPRCSQVPPVGSGSSAEEASKETRPGATTHLSWTSHQMSGSIPPSWAWRPSGGISFLPLVSTISSFQSRGKARGDLGGRNMEGLENLSSGRSAQQQSNVSPIMADAPLSHKLFHLVL